MDATELRKGTFITHKGELWQAVEVTHRTPGNLRGFVQVKLRNVRNGGHITERFSSNQTVESAWLDRRRAQYLYDDATMGPVFMDNESYEQFGLTPEVLGDAVHYLKENTEIQVLFFRGKAINVDVPTFIELRVTQTEPGVRGDTATNVTKPATLETGYVVNVPLFINEDDVIKIDTRDGSYASKVTG